MHLVLTQFVYRNGGRRFEPPPPTTTKIFFIGDSYGEFKTNYSYGGEQASIR